jgi:hypothetical protein
VHGRYQALRLRQARIGNDEPDSPLRFSIRAIIPHSSSWGSCHLSQPSVPGNTTVDGRQFDALSRALVSNRSRRSALGVVISATLLARNSSALAEPGNGQGKGHDKDRGEGHDKVKGRGHNAYDCDPATCPPNPNPTTPEAGFCCPNGSCSCAGGCDCPDCWVEQLDKGPDDEPLPPEQVRIIREFCCNKCGGGPDECCSRCDATGACEKDPDTGPISGGSIRRR